MRAIEIRIRAERRCGELLVEMKRAQGKRSDLATSGQADAKSFSEQREAYGISEPQARRWQKLAAVPEAEFEATFARPEKPSTTGIINRGKKRNVVDPLALGSGAGCSTSRGMACSVPIPRKSVRPYFCDSGYRKPRRRQISPASEPRERPDCRDPSCAQSIGSAERGPDDGRGEPG